MNTWIQRYKILIDYKITQKHNNYIILNKGIFISFHIKYDVYKILLDFHIMLQTPTLITKYTNNTRINLEKSLIDHFNSCVTKIKEKYNIDNTSLFNMI